MKRIVVGNVQTNRRRRPAPTISLQLCDPTGKVIANIPRTTPDGGAEATVGGMDVLHALGFNGKDLSSSTFDLVMADKSTPLLVVGEKEVTANYEGVSAKITITFSPDITGL